MTCTITSIGLFQGVESFGINYAQVANNLPPADKVLELFSTLNLTKTRIYDTNPQILSSFANSNIEIIVPTPTLLTRIVLMGFL